MAERIEQYLDEVGAQVRWKRVRPALTQELRTHLEEQAEAYRAEGLPAAEAAAEAARWATQNRSVLRSTPCTGRNGRR